VYDFFKIIYQLKTKFSIGNHTPDFGCVFDQTEHLAWINQDMMNGRRTLQAGACVNKEGDYCELLVKQKENKKYKIKKN
jgi:SH3-like domain-containing protein